MSVDLMRTAFVGIQAGGELAMQEVNRAVEEAGARGAAAGRIDRAYIAGARVLAFGPDGKRRTIFVMKITHRRRELDDDGKAFSESCSTSRAERWSLKSCSSPSLLVFVLA